MNEVINALRHRRSVRKYDGTPVDGDLLKLVLEAGINAPKGDNFKTVEFILIEKRDTLLELAHIRKVGTKMLENAGAAIIVLGNEEKSDLWMEDASIAMAYMHLAADSLGLGSCWIQMWNRDDVNGADLEPVLRERFGIPAYLHPMAILSLGNISEHPKGHDVESVDWSRVHHEKYETN